MLRQNNDDLFVNYLEFEVVGDTFIENHSNCQGCGVGAGSGVVRCWRFLSGVEFELGFLSTWRVEVGFFCPTPIPDAQLDHFLHHTPKLGIPVEMV